MRFALFGDGPAALAVARAVVGHPAHRLTCVVGQPQYLVGLPAGVPDLRFSIDWEELLSDPEIDAVIVSGAGDEKQQAVRQLLLAGKCVLLPPELAQPASFFYELALLEAESPGRLFPLLFLRGHPLVLKLRELVLNNDLGKLRHARLERRIAVLTTGGAPPLFTETDVAQELLRDADLLRTLCGGYDQVTAARSGNPEQGYSLATVTLAGGSAPQAVWTASASAAEGDWKLELSGDAGSAVLEGGADLAGLRLTIETSSGSQSCDEYSSEAGLWLLETFVASAEGGSTRACATDGSGFAKRAGSRNRPAAADTPDAGRDVSLWGELARAVEIVEAVERSVRRRRTIDVFFETPSERGIFKTQMTAVGCSLLVLTLGAVVVYLGLAATMVLPPLLKKMLVVLIFVPLALFLALQLLVFVARPSGQDGLDRLK